jgi:hypothetical protein
VIAGKGPCFCGGGGADADADVVVVYDHKTYDSPTAAAAAVTGKPVNGWAFWNVRSRDGKEKGSLKELRGQLDVNDDEA